jgi:hypothetical protein
VKIDDAVGNLGLRLIHQHVVVVAEDVAEIERPRHEARTVPRGDRLDQVEREVAVGAAEVPIELDRLGHASFPSPHHRV